MIEFRKVRLPEEVDLLLDVDHKIFAQFPDDQFSAEDWQGFDSFWMLEAETILGCSAFLANVDYDEKPLDGSLYIVTTGILPEFQRCGFGRKQKEWQISYARESGFSVIVTNMRESNLRIIRLNESLGFRHRLIEPDFYDGPKENTIVMELLLKDSRLG